MSTIKVNKLEQESGCTATIGGGSGKTVTVDATTLTLGRCGGTVSLASGATQSGFGRTGTVDWCTTVKTSPLTAVSGKGYFVNTCGGAITVTLPSSPSAGDIVSVKDYKGTFAVACKALTLGRGGSKINGACADYVMETKSLSSTLVYVDGTQGWLTVDDSTTFAELKYVTATGGTITTSGDYKIHTFTGDGCFQVTCAGGSGSNKVSYLVVAGGSGGGGDGAGGGGAGGYREGKCTSDPYTASPLNAPDGLAVPVATYPITVGGGGSGISGPPWPAPGTAGSTSTFSSITSAGGGGGSYASAANGGSGGGGGRGSPYAGGTGNTPPTSPAQGTNGGPGSNPSPPTVEGGGGGGGATAVGTTAPTANSNGGAGGAGATSSINGTPTARAGGGGGSAGPATSGDKGVGGSGGGGKGVGGPGYPTGCATVDNATAGTTNSGGGGGGGTGGPAGGNPANHHGAAGGSGIVIIRYKYQN